MRAPEIVTRPNRNKLQQIAEDTYIYGYPLVLMDITKRTQTATALPTTNSAPLNQFAYGQFIRGIRDQYALQPNVDCLRSCAWLDLRKEPIVLSIPQADR